MNETKFKVLMYGNEYVDPNLLHKGVYSCQMPSPYSKDDTIETLVERSMFVKNTLGDFGYLTDTYFENLKKCILVDVDIIINLV